MSYTEDEINEIVEDLDNSKALHITSLFLAQPDQEVHPYKELGYSTGTEAYQNIADHLHQAPLYVRGLRDHFDRHTDSNRVGFEGDLTGRKKAIFDVYSQWERVDLLNLVKTIMEKPWPKEEAENNMPEYLDEELPDLQDCITYCQARLDQVATPIDIALPNGFINELVRSYKAIIPNDNVTVVGNHSFCIKTPDDNFLAISMTEIGRCWAVIPYVDALERYIHVLDEMVKSIFEGRRNSGGVKELFKQLPDQNWGTILGQEYTDIITDYLNNKFSNDPDYAERIKRFLSDRNWSGIPKKLDRVDLLTSSITRVGGWLAVASDRRGDLSIALRNTLNSDVIVQRAIENSEDNSTNFEDMPTAAITGGYNKIYYGAPSTGKSYAINKLTETTPETVIKTVFHVDTQNSDFIGCLKPSSDGDDISYTFQSGPFTDTLVKALNDPARMYYLVIEEINRASAAAVFGEVFQLLDRDTNGRTETGYEVTPADPMHSKYLNAKVESFSGKMYIPSNLTLLATMNSSDQAVMPMDTAFKRRWSFQYKPLDFDKACTDGQLDIVKTKADAPLNVSWKDFAQEINKILSDEELPEDRHLGPFFVSPDELSTPQKSKEALSGKVFMYLWDDILRHKQKSIIIDASLKTNGALMTAFQNGEPVFSKKLIDALELKVTPAPQPDAPLN